MRGFARTAGDGDRVGGNAFEGGSGGAEVIVESKRKSFFDADAARTQVAIGERSGDEAGGTFVFLPGADFEGIAHRFAHATFFKGGRNQNGFAGARDDQSKEALAEPPVNAGEIVEGTAGADEERVEFWIELRHEVLGMEQASVEFVGRNGMNAIAEGFESGERGRQLRRLCSSGRDESYGGDSR